MKVKTLYNVFSEKVEKIRPYNEQDLVTGELSILGKLIIIQIKLKNIPNYLKKNLLNKIKSK